MSTSGYTFSLLETAVDSGQDLEKLSGEVTDKGWVGKTEAYSYAEDGTKSVSNSLYYGVHQASDKTFSHYSSKASAITSSSYPVSSAKEGTPGFAFSADVFDFDAVNSTKDLYVFNLKADMVDSAYIAAINMSFSGSCNYGENLTVSVLPDGTLSEMSYYFKIKNVEYKAVSTFATIDKDADFDSSFGDFTGFVGYVLPTFAQTTCYQMGAPTTVEGALKTMFPDTYQKIPNFFTYDLRTYAYRDPFYNSLTTKDLYFYFGTGLRHIQNEAFAQALKSLNEAGITMTPDTGSVRNYTGTLDDGNIIVKCALSDWDVEISISAKASA